MENTVVAVSSRPGHTPTTTAAAAAVVEVEVEVVELQQVVLDVADTLFFWSLVLVVTARDLVSWLLESTLRHVLTLAGAGTMLLRSHASRHVQRVLAASCCECCEEAAVVSCGDLPRSYRRLPRIAMAAVHLVFVAAVRSRLLQRLLFEGIRGCREVFRLVIPPMSRWTTILGYPRSSLLRPAFVGVVLFVTFTFVLTYIYSQGSSFRVWTSAATEFKPPPPFSLERVAGRLDSPNHVSWNSSRPGKPRRKSEAKSYQTSKLNKEKHAAPSEKENGRTSKEQARTYVHRSETPANIGMEKMTNLSYQITRVLKQDSVHQHEGPHYKLEELSRQIAILVDAMTSERTMLPSLSAEPTCQGDLAKDEVEDLFCIHKPKYLSMVKNPCWYAERNDSVTLRCLPYFHILGVAKAGTTDLWNRLMSHPHIVSNNGLLHKEGLWWSWRRYGFSGYKRHQVVTFDGYVSLFESTSRQVQRSMERGTSHHKVLITGDASPPDFWDFRGWRFIRQNRGQDVPHVITPHLMKHFYNNPKFILMFRNPIDRLYSDYFFLGGGLTSEDFHNDIIISINMLSSCVKLLGLQRCFFDHKLYLKLPVRLPFACYTVFMREWLRIYPRETFLFLVTEEYEVDPVSTIQTVTEFLGLNPLEDSVLEEIMDEQRARVTVQKHNAGPMKNETKALLRRLLDPCTVTLTQLLKMDKFHWNT